MAEGRSAVSRALARLNGDRDEPRVKPLAPEDVERLGSVLFWRILVEPIVPRYDGVIEAPPQVEQAERILACQGRVLQVGHFAYRSRTNAGLNLAEEPNIPKVGDVVLFQQYAGQEVHLRSGHILRILDDTEVLMIIKDPDRIKGYL